ncbi:MAG: ATP-binding protein [Actinomycetota bacterium]
MSSGAPGGRSRRGGTPRASLRIEARLQLGPHAAAASRRRLAFFEGEVPRDRLEAVRLLVSELVTNSYKHAGLRDVDTAVLTVDLDPDRIRVQVEDQGRGFRGLTPRLAPDRASGWGLTIVDRLADRWGVIENGSTVVWFELDLRPARTKVPSPTRKRASGHRR